MNPIDHRKTHVIVWPEHITQCFAPCLDSRIKPQSVTFLFPEDKTSQVKTAAKQFEVRGIKTDFVSFENAWDIGYVRGRVSKFIERADSHEMLLNMSGNASALSLGAYKVFYDNRLPIFTVNPDNDHVVWMCPEGQLSIDLEDRIDLTTYLKLHGYDVAAPVQRSAIPECRRRLGQVLVSSQGRFSRAVHDLNWLSVKAESTLISPPISEGVKERDAFQELIECYRELNLLEVSGNRIEFRDEDARNFASGGWLEEYVYSELRGLSGRKGIQDLARGIEFSVEVNGQKISNELDVAFLANNRLYFFECKTVKMNNTKDGFKKQNSFLYKLNSLKSVIGGKHAQAMLLSYKMMGKRQQERARVMGLEIAVSNDLVEIKSRVKSWMENHSQ